MRALAYHPHRILQQGFSIVSAIFLLVVLGLLGAVMMNLASVQHTTSAQDIQGTRAYLSAKGGVEWALYKVLRDPPPPAAAPACPSTTLTLGEAGNTFSVAVNCTTASFTDGGIDVTVYRIVSTASQGAAGTPSFIERSVQATVSR